MLGFETDKPIIGVVHLPPLPGSPRFENLDRVERRAIHDAERLAKGGVDGLIVENYGDQPFNKETSKMTVSSLSVICSKIKDVFKGPIGVNVLRNDWKSALSISHVLDLSFVRINVYTGCYSTPSGYIEGEAGKIERFRDKFDMKIFILADIDVKHAEAIYPKNVRDAAQDAADRGNADGLIVTGERTGEEVRLNDLEEVKECVDVPVLAGSGVNDENIKEVLSNSHGAIIGTYFKEDGVTSNKVSLSRVKELVEKADEVR